MQLILKLCLSRAMSHSCAAIREVPPGLGLGLGLGLEPVVLTRAVAQE